MERERKKRLRTIRLIIVEIFMVILVLVLVVVLTFIAMGYSVNSEGKLDQSGLVQVESYPTGGTVSIDGRKLFAKTNTSKLLPSGEHHITVDREGFLGWEKDVLIESGKLLKLDYVRLIKADRVMEKVRDFKNELAIFTTAPDRNTLLYAEKDSPEWLVMNIRSDDVAVKKIDVSELIPIDAKILNYTWSDDSSKLLLKLEITTKVEKEPDMVSENFLILDVKNFEQSIDLTKAFSLNFTDVRFSSGAGDKLWVLENGNLRTITGQELSKVLLSGVENFYNNETRIMYTATLDTEKIIGLYIEGDEKGLVLKRVPVDTTVKMAVSRYLDYYYISFMENNRLYIYRSASLPNPEKGLDRLELLAENDTGILPNDFDVKSNGRFVVAKQKDRLLVFDGEVNRYAEFTMDMYGYNWVDEHLISNVVDGKMAVYDFDGTNKRELSKASAYESVITANNRWIYYICAENCLTGTEMKAEIRREKLVN